MNIDDLMQAAAKADPTYQRKSKWIHLYPILNSLLQRGFNKMGAVRWLMRETNMSEPQMISLYNAWYAYNKKQK